MIEIIIFVEGQTELDFGNGILRKHLAACGMHLSARLPGRSRRQGGVPRWPSVCRDILATLKERRRLICTTMFDFYAMPADWPGRREASAKPVDQRGVCVERALLASVDQAVGNDLPPDQFIPYVQVHEFEALLFADPIKAGRTLEELGGSVRLAEEFASILDAAGQPEAIDDGRDTCPSRRIGKLFPEYQKRSHGRVLAERIGLNAMRARCPHFAQWLARLESLAT